jgi:hypothetical protein
MDELDQVVTVAVELHRRHGRRAINVANERAEIALLSGDKPAAETWFDIAEAIKRLIEHQGSV